LLEWKPEIAAPDVDEKALRARIKNNDINGYVVIPKDALDGGEIVYSGDNASNQTVALLFSKVAQSVVIEKRAKRAGLSEVELVALNRPVNVSVRHTTGEEEGTAGVFAFLVGYMIAFFIYILITLYGINVMRSVVTEKTSRVVELLVAATKPRAMMSGKIIGVGFAGLLQIAIWLVIGAIAISQRDAILDLLGAKPSAKSVMPSLSMLQLATTLGCFVLGYLFYSALYAAVGAMVSSEQDSQQAQMPVTFLLVIGIIAITAVTNDPRGTTAAIMTMVPFWSPMLMPLRFFLGGATLAQVALSLAILAVSTVLVARAAAKIYRVGILMYGKRPTVRELVRWLRY
jgi:ABC-2 type transport system permease protein